MVVGEWPSKASAPVGGVEAAVSCLVRALLRVRSDLDLHVVGCAVREDSAGYTEGDPAYTVHAVRAHLSMWDLMPGFTPRRRIERLLRALRPDVVHVQAAATLLDGRRFPAVLTVHGIRERDAAFRNVPLRRLRVVTHACLERRARGRYRHVIAIVGYVAQYLESQLKGRCHFIPNPIEAEFFQRRRRESGPRVLYVGSLIPRKNLHGVLGALGLLARAGVAWRLRVAGPSPDSAYAERVQGLIRQWNIVDRVEFLGYLDRPALLEELERTRCLVLPSFQETAPMVVAEAGAVGVPQVVTPAGGTAEMIIHGHSGMLVDAHSPASIADGLRPLLESADLADRFGQRARDVAQVCHPDAVARQTLAVYDRVAGESAGR